MERDDGSERCTARWMQKVYREWQIDDYWLWKLWNMQVPPKVKNFCWQLASQFLPTRDALNSKHVACALQCHMCHNHDETALHLFANYRETTIMWNSLGLPINQHCNGNISDWFFLNISSLKEDCLCKFAMACWGLWCSRNDSVWKGVPYEMHAMLYAAMSLWSNWKLVNGVDDPCENDSVVMDQWTAPHHGRLKLNSDIAMMPNSSIMGMGWIIRDDEGRFIAAKGMTCVGTFTLRPKQ